MEEPTTLNGEIAARVRDAARQAGISETDLAAQAGIAERTFRRRMTGRVKWETDELTALADVLNADLTFLWVGRAA